ncbi:hypothetical protein A4X13_0g8599 [Tilletia indica]|uniref:Uncharacterized protein n=1 Tax=Tilletia indica TaxID=43049 RepID=A0A177SYW6_9BASI|nr:hypothetical protein A4X13_0g8599 [Tilletia indica]
MQIKFAVLLFALSATIAVGQLDPAEVEAVHACEKRTTTTNLLPGRTTKHLTTLLHAYLLLRPWYTASPFHSSSSPWACRISSSIELLRHQDGGP